MDKDKSVSMGAFSLNGHDSLYSTLATRAVFMVPTLGHESTNRQFTEFHSSAGQQHSSSLPIWRYHDMLLQAFTCHFLAEAVIIIISHVISHCMCSMPHVVKCSCMFTVFISFHVIHILILVAAMPALKHSLYLSCFFFSSFVHWYTNVTDCQIFHSKLQKN